MSLNHRLLRLSNVIKKLKIVLIEQHKNIEISKKQYEQFTLQQSKNLDLQKSAEKLSQSINELYKTITDNQTQQKSIAASIKMEQEALDKAQKNYENELNKNQTYQAQKQLREQLQNKLKVLVYKPDDHKKLLEKLEQLTMHEQKAQELSKKIANQEHCKKEIQQLCNQLRIIKQKNTDLAKQLKVFADLEKNKQELANKHQHQQEQLRDQQHQKEVLLQEKGKLENEQRKLEQFAKEQKEHEKKIIALKEMVDDYQTLATAFGKDGVQALLIEDALPEIEQEANELLAQLTNNQAHIIIESLRDLKKGGTKETLDIKISDPMGIRSYELFSGGEAFRIDFALRIAISKLLARRAGTSLQTLIIDEGFGSQDEEGLALLMDAIYAIQDNFNKVIIVSHLTAMKDQFPVHFFVQKGPNGSTVNVIQQG
jgi:DNA repair protein SbcC/Rad50